MCYPQYLSTIVRKCIFRQGGHTKLLDRLETEKERMKAGKMTGLSYGVCARQGECGGGRVEQADVGNTRTGQSGK